MRRTSTKALLFVAALGLSAAACSSEGIVDLALTQTVEIDFHALEGNVTAQTQRGDIVFDLRSEPDFAALEDRLRCVGLDPYASALHIERLDAEGMDSFLDFRVDIAAYPEGVWTPLVDYASLVTDQSSRGFDDAGFKIYLEGLDVLEATAFATTPHYELRITSRVPEAVMDLELRLDLAIVFSSQAGACPGP